MFSKFHEKRQEEGFTLIELLVVILIIAILAAIAIPVFLNQRKKGWVSQSKSTLKNAATAMETCATDNNGDYGDCDEADLESSGFNQTVGVDFAIISASSTAGYCFSADHENLDAAETYYFDSDTGEPTTTACT